MFVYTLEQSWKVGLRSTCRRCRFWQKKKKNNHLFRWSSFWSWRVCKQAKSSHLSSQCLMRILVKKHNWAIFLQKWASRGRYSQWWSLSGHVERIFVYKNWRVGYWQHCLQIIYSKSFLHPFTQFPSFPMSLSFTFFQNSVKHGSVRNYWL